MSQTIHILQKDLRRLWREILFSVTALAAYAAHEPGRGDFLDLKIRAVTPDPGILTAVLLLSWVVLVVRVCHEEMLIGDRHFWITRPYEWKKLLLAKALFIVVTIHLPLLVAQGWLLARLGIAPFRYLPELLRMQILMPGLLIAGAAMMAGITRHVSQAIGALLFFLILLAFCLALWSVLFPSGESLPDELKALLLLGVSITVLVSQFRRLKRAQPLRATIGGLAVWLLIITAAPSRMLAERDFSPLRSAEHAAIQVKFSGWKTIEVTPFDAFIHTGKARRPMMFLVSDVEPGSFVHITAAKVAVDGGSAGQWSSKWSSMNEVVLPGEDSIVVPLAMPEPFFDRVRGLPIGIRVSLALTAYRKGHPRNSILTEVPFEIPRRGACSGGQLSWETMDCYAAPGASVMLAEASSSSNCADAAIPATTAYAWNLDSSFAGRSFSVSPVEKFRLFFSMPRGAKLCPEKSLTLFFPVEGQQTRLATEFRAVLPAE